MDHPSREPDGKHDLHRDSLLLMGAQVLYKLSGVVVLLILSRTLSAESIGVFFFAVAFAQAFQVAASFNLNPVMMRRVAATPGDAGRHLGALLGFLAVSGPIYLFLVSGAALLLRAEIWQLVLAVALYKFLESVSAAVTSFFMAMKRATYQVAIGISVQLVFVAIFIGAMLTAPSLHALVATHAVRAALLAGVALLVAHTRLCKLRLGWDRSLVRQAPAFILLSLMARMEGQLDDIVLGFLTEYETVGHYHLALNVVLAAYFITFAMGQAYYPRLAELGPGPESRRVLMSGIRQLAALGLIGAGAIYLLAAPLAALLFGPLGDEVAPLLRAAAALLPMGLVSTFIVTSLPALHLERSALLVAAVGTVVALAALVVLIPLFGAHGAVYARLGAAAVQVCAALLLVMRAVKPKSTASG
jgi:O-antigen/teichoic acid export membrane protein